MELYGKYLILIILIWFLSYGTSLLSKEIHNISTPSLVHSTGYPLEEHNIITADGYNLTLFHMPPFQQFNNELKRINTRVALLMHGFQRSSIDWVLNGPTKSLAYILADAGYDVWLGNARGTRYSQTHIKNPTTNSDFWNFSWHEIGIYDLPAFVEYILLQTGAKKLHYIAHSQGTTSFIVASSTTPQFNKRIKSAHLLGPAITFDNSPTLQSILLLEPALKLIVGTFGNFDLGSTSRIGEKFINIICKDGSIAQELCAYRISSITGWNSPYLNRTMLPNIITTDTVGASSKQLLHFMQVGRTGRFRQFDYGKRENLRTYQQPEPPNYNIEAISVPTYLYYCDNDNLSDVKDVQNLVFLYPRSALKNSQLLPFHGCNHIDFLFGVNVTEYLNSEILNVLENYEAGTF